MAKKKALVIELGEHFIRVWRPERNAKTLFSDGGSFILETEAGAVSDGVITNPEALAQRLTEELSRHGLRKARNVIFSIPSSRIAVREVILPPIKDSRIKDVVSTNAGDYFPINLTSYHITHSVLSAVSDSDNRRRVIVYAAPISLLAGYFKLATAAGLHIQAIDYAGNSQFNIYKALNPGGVNLYAFINHNISYLTFVNGDNLLLQRTLAFGGGALIEDYQAESPEKGLLDVYTLLSDPTRTAEIYAVILRNRSAASARESHGALTISLQISGTKLSITSF